MTNDTDGAKAIEAAARIALVWRNPQLRSAMHPWTMASAGQREQATEAAKDICRAYLAVLPGWRLVPVVATHDIAREAADHLPVTPGGATDRCAARVYEAGVEAAPNPPGLHSEDSER